MYIYKNIHICLSHTKHGKQTIKMKMMMTIHMHTSVCLYEPTFVGVGSNLYLHECTLDCIHIIVCVLVCVYACVCVGVEPMLTIQHYISSDTSDTLRD